MAWVLREEEMNAVLSLDGPKRYRYFIKKVADEGLIWSLWQESGWVLAGDDLAHEAVPVWPHAKFALLCADRHWAGCQPKSIDMEIWLDRWIPGIERDDRRVAVFPTPERKGVVIEPRRLEADLRNELSQYE